MGLRHFGRLALLVKHNPRIQKVIEKKLKLRERYGPWVTLTFWECLKNLERIPTQPLFKHCLETNLATLGAADPTQRELVSRFLKDLSKLQEKVRDFLTKTFRVEARREKELKEFAKEVEIERERIKKALEEIF